jgi:death on curing protein
VLPHLDPRFVLRVHDFIVENYGGLAGVLSFDVLESSLARPFCGYFPTHSAQASALMHGLATGHAFADGNKRTAVACTVISLDMAGVYVVGNPSFDKIDDWAVALADNKMSREELEVIFKRRLRLKPRPTAEAHRPALHRSRRFR